MEIQVDDHTIVGLQIPISYWFSFDVSAPNPVAASFLAYKHFLRGLVSISMSRNVKSKPVLAWHGISSNEVDMYITEKSPGIFNARINTTIQYYLKLKDADFIRNEYAMNQYINELTSSVAHGVFCPVTVDYLTTDAPYGVTPYGNWVDGLWGSDAVFPESVQNIIESYISSDDVVFSDAKDYRHFWHKSWNNEEIEHIINMFHIDDKGVGATHKQAYVSSCVDQIAYNDVNKAWQQLDKEQERGVRTGYHSLLIKGSFQ